MFSSHRRSLVSLLAVAVLLTFGGVGRAESPFTGTWKLTALPVGVEITLWLVRIDETEGQFRGTILGTGLPDFKTSTMGPVRADAKSLRMTIKSNNASFNLVVYPPAGEAKPKQMLGSLEVGGRRDMARLERTDWRELSPEKAEVRGPIAEALGKAYGTEDMKEREAAFAAIRDKHAGQPAAVYAAMELVGIGVEGGAAEAEIRTRADQAIKLAGRYGPEMELHATAQLAQHFVQKDKLANLALEYARRAEKLLTAGDPAATRAGVYKTIATVLHKTGKAAEAQDVAAKVAKLEDVLDQEYLKTSIPFKIETAGRRTRNDRVVLLELFTGAQCPPCVAADVAFDALLRTYPPGELALIQYHLHVPAPDPLANKNSERRAEFYDIEGTPAVYLDGEPVRGVGGLMTHAQDRYQLLRKMLEARLDILPLARLKLSADRKGDKIEITADVSALKRPGEQTRLKLLLVEEVVRYPGTNGQRLHHHVVRGVAGEADGIPLLDSAVRKTVSIDLGQVRKSLLAYLAEYSQDRRFPVDERPMELKNLKIVGIVQDTKTKEVLQAAQIDLPKEPVLPKPAAK